VTLILSLIMSVCEEG